MMTYEEFMKRDREDVFKDFTSVEKAKEANLIPESFKDLVPNKCTCGSDFIISLNRKTLRCCDPYCIEKLSYRMASFFSSYKIKDFGYSGCRDTLQYLKDSNKLKIPSFIEVLNFPDYDELFSYLGAKGNILYNAIRVVRNTRLTFPELISKLNIPQLGASALKIFSGVKTPEDLLELLKTNKLRLYLNSKGVFEPKRIYEIETHLRDIFEFVKCLDVPLLSLSLYDIDVCITGRVSVDGYSVSRDDFFNICNRICNINGQQVLSIRDSKALKSVKSFISDSPSSSNKYLTAVSRIKNGEDCEIVTAQDFVDRLRRITEVWKNQVN